MDENLKGSDVRLWSLVAERSQPQSNRQRIDQRIWDLFGEEWAVMFTDLSGFSRQVATFGIIHFLQVIYEQKQLLLPIAADHDGILIKIEADSFLIIFKRPTAAVRCAVEMQHACRRHNLQRLPEEQVLLCVGIGFGKILRIGDTDVFGKEVNAASKLGEDTASAGEVLLTEAARVAAADELSDLSFVDLEQTVPGSEQNWRLQY